jgi:hypothetical protein
MIMIAYHITAASGQTSTKELCLTTSASHRPTTSALPLEMSLDSGVPINTTTHVRHAPSITCVSTVNSVLKE